MAKIQSKRDVYIGPWGDTLIEYYVERNEGYGVSNEMKSVCIIAAGWLNFSRSKNPFV